MPIPEFQTNLEAIESAGVVGAGGAGFPTAVKLKTSEIPNGVFIANAANVNPCLAHNIHQVELHAAQLVRGIKYCMEMQRLRRLILPLNPSIGRRFWP